LGPGLKKREEKISDRNKESKATTTVGGPG
jgi:hypothetical protein